jgi:hypothetical protein
MKAMAKQLNNINENNMNQWHRRNIICESEINGYLMAANIEEAASARGNEMKASRAKKISKSIGENNGCRRPK